MSEFQLFPIQINPEDTGQVLVTEDNGKESTYPIISDINNIIEKRRLLTLGRGALFTVISGTGIAEMFFIAHGDLLDFPNTLTTLSINNLYEGGLIGFLGVCSLWVASHIPEIIEKYSEIPLFERRWNSFFENYFDDTLNMVKQSEFLPLYKADESSTALERARYKSVLNIQSKG